MHVITILTNKIAPKMLFITYLVSLFILNDTTFPYLKKRKMMRVIYRFCKNNIANVQHIARVMLKIIMLFIDDNCFSKSAALTFATILALVPLAMLSVAALSIFPVFRSLEGTIQTFIFNNFVPSTGNTVQQYVEIFIKQTANLSLVGLIFLLITAITLFFTVETNLNLIFKVPRRRSIKSSLLIYWAMLTIGPLLLASSITASSYISHYANFISGVDNIVLLLPFVCIWCAFTIFYRLVPNADIKLSHALFAGFISALLFECAKFLFTLYFTQFTNYQMIYGALAVIPIFLLWIYLSWNIFFLGAEIVHIMGNGAVNNKLPRFYLACCIIYHMSHCQKLNLGVQYKQLLSSLEHSNLTDVNEMLQMLSAQKYIKENQSGKYILIRDLSKVSLNTFCDDLQITLPGKTDLLDTAWYDKLQSCFADLDQYKKQIFTVSLEEIFRH
ncbi:MAG: hypothetical protein COB50_05105 [Thiotrichales bacterium]|nr:MAG: hypothetical protein COB50_05105 [Thiotrichales bacterium]